MDKLTENLYRWVGKLWVILKGLVKIMILFKINLLGKHLIKIIFKINNSLINSMQESNRIKVCKKIKIISDK